MVCWAVSGRGRFPRWSWKGEELGEGRRARGGEMSSGKGEAFRGARGAASAQAGEPFAIVPAAFIPLYSTQVAG